MIADLVCDKDDVFRPREGFAREAMPIMDLGEKTYLIILPLSESPGRVYWPDAKHLVAETVSEFFAMLQVHAGFYKLT